jgi:hypothetical protein
MRVYRLRERSRPSDDAAGLGQCGSAPDAPPRAKSRANHWSLSAGRSKLRRGRRRLAEQRMPPVVVAFPDCFTRLGGNQYINSASMGAWEDFLLHEMLPGIEQRFRCGGAGRRGVVRQKLRAMALSPALRHSDIWSAAACHSGDMGFEICYVICPTCQRSCAPSPAPRTRSSAGAAARSSISSKPKKISFAIVNAAVILGMNVKDRIDLGCGHMRPAEAERRHPLLPEGSFGCCRSTGRLARPQWSAASLVSTAVSFAAVLMVRIQFPPADSPSLTGSSAPRSRTSPFRAGVRAMGGGAVGRDGDRPATWRQSATMSLLGQIPVPQCQ